MLKSVEKKYKIEETCRVKFIEISGRKYLDQLGVSDPFGKNCLDEEDCMICKGETIATNCKTSNIGDQIICKKCDDRNVLI